MKPNYLPLPINDSDRVRSAVAQGFVITEAKHSPLVVISPHAHERANITVLLEGVFEESYSGRAEDCRRSSLLFRPVGEKHADRFGRSGAHNLSIEIEESRLQTISPHTDALDRVWQWRDFRAMAIGARICDELRAGDQAATLALESLALELLALASRRHGTLAQSLRAPFWLRHARDMLHDRFKEDICVDDIAQVAGVHPVHLARAFRMQFRCTPGQYLRRLRTDWAAQQLTLTERPIAEIAQTAGFADQSHFTRTFKLATGFTPARFRKRTRL